MNVTLYAYPDGDGWTEIRGSVENGMVKNTMDDMKYEYRDGCSRLTLRKQMN